VKNNEPELFSKINKIMLPGDYIAMKLTGEIWSTPSGLSEGIFWDFQKNKVADFLLNYFGLKKDCIPDLINTFSFQGKVNAEAAKATGLQPGTPVAYRAGDQPNNAMSLNVLRPGEVAATGGTSGVVYGVVAEPKYDKKNRVNGFAHVNHSEGAPHIGILLCINGAGIQYSWMKHTIAPPNTPYSEMEISASTITPGSDGLYILPFGNGAERMLLNRDIGAQILGLNFNRHTRSHLYRAALEGVAFSFIYGMEILKEIGIEVSIVKVGNDNLFQSDIFSQTIANVMDCRIEMMETTGAIGAAKAAGVGVGIYSSVDEAMKEQHLIKIFSPENEIREYQNVYLSWKKKLHQFLT
jgi:xylulokinase